MLVVTTRNNAEKTYRNEESDAYLQSATSWANIDAFYRQYEANSFASAASTLASSTGTPWAAYDAGFYAAQAANVTAVSNAAKTNAIAQATAQKTAEVAQTNAETTWRNAYATASSVLNTGIAGAHLGFATAQSLIYSSMGGNNLQLPTVSRPTDLAGEYTVPGPGNTYRTSISSVSSTNYYYGWWGGYWWGAWGYYGSGYWYSGYGGYYGYLYGSQVSSAAGVTLQEPAMQFPGSFWQIDSDQIADQMRDGAIEVRYGDAKVPELVTPVDVAGGLTASISANVAVSDGMASSNAEVMAILQGLSDTAGELWTLVGSTTQTVLSSRPATLLAEYASELVNAELQNSVSSSSESSLPSDKGTASSSTSVTVGRNEGSLDAAVSAVQKTALIAKPADLTAMQKLNAYLQGVNNQKGPSIFDQASQISVNLVMGYINGQNGSITEYGTGFAKGFFIDGAWGNVEGIGTILKFGWGAVKQSWYNQARAITFGNEWIFENRFFDFNDQRKVEENVVKTGQMIFKVLNAVGTELGEEAFAHYHALANGSAADLQELGGKHQQVAAAVMSIGVLLSEKLRDMTPETRGRISGAITWEIAQTAAEIIFTAGAATVATKGAKFARIADKLADFAKTYDKLGDIAQPVLNRLRQISEPGGELRKLLEKFDEKAFVVERGVKVVNETLQNACFTPNTLVMTNDGQRPLGEVRAGQQGMAFDFTNAQWMFRTVKANLRNRYSGELVTISIGNDKIEATAEHPFWVLSGNQLALRPIPEALSAGEDEGEKLPGRWVNASDLDEGDVLESSKGNPVSIAAIATRSVENLEVCNLSVGENHCYAVGSESVLVHNATWCSVLTEMHPGWDKIRANLAKKFNVVLDRIHGHHIVQKTIPKEAAEKVLVNSRWKNVGNLTEAEFTVAKSSLTPDQQSAWYISESHKLMKKADVEIYESTSAATEKVKKELLKEHLENPTPGKSGANLTLALNDSDNVHNLATHEAVYKRLKAVEGDQARTERVLREIGEIFREGKVPRANAQGWDYTYINNKPVK
jgi:hypothetical protein